MIDMIKKKEVRNPFIWKFKKIFFWIVTDVEK